jgi:imidazolonepropionase-like amidohydrolase
MATTPASATKRILFRNVQIFDGSGAGLVSGEVLVAGDRILKVARRPDGLFNKKDARISEDNAEVIDGGGAVLMPGMVESHAHLTWPSSTERFVPEFIQPIEEMMLITAQNARILLDQGFTSAYSAGALSERIEVVIRDNIKAGYLPGPRLRASTLERSPEGDAEVTGGVTHGRGPEAMRAFIRKCKSMGIDQVKLVLSGEDALVPGSSHHLMCTEAEAQAAGEASREMGMPLSAHAQGNEAIKMGLRAGVRMIYHCTYADDEAIDMLAAQKERIFMAPAIGVIVATLEATPPPHIDMSSMKEMAKPVIERANRLIPELKRRGVRVLIGGDYGFPFNPNGTNARDLQHFIDLFDYTPSEVLVAATRLGGELMELEIGQIKEGFLADILLVNGDVTKDVRILQNKANLLAIMKGGQFHKCQLPRRMGVGQAMSREDHV